MLEILAIPSMVFFDLISGSAESGITAVQAVGVEGLLLSAVASFLTSIIVIKGLLALARRVRVGYFVIFIGLVAIALNAIL
jgi:undecaprenyl pyrophosphate phosphatase UppP